MKLLMSSRRWVPLVLVAGIVGAMSLTPVLAGPNDTATKKFVRKVAKKIATKKANQAVAPVKSDVEALMAPKTGQYSIDPHEFFGRFNSSHAVVRDEGTPIFGACKTTSGGISAPVHLPQGATVTKMTVYWYDADGASDIKVDLWRRTHSSNAGASMGSVTSSGSGGDGSGTTTTFAPPPTIDNAIYSYEVWGISDPNECIRSVVIEYTY